MDIKNFIYCILGLFYFSACPSEECRDAASTLTFELPISYSPLKDTFNVGDTLFIRSEFSDILYEPDEDLTQKLEDWNFFSSISINIIVDNVFANTAMTEDQILNEDVDFQLINYTVNEGTGIIIEKYNYANEVYSFKLDLLLEKPGLYYISTISDLGITSNTSQQRFAGQCPNQSVYAEFKVNNGNAIENNFDLIEGKPPVENLLPHNFLRWGGFAFYVKD